MARLNLEIPDEIKRRAKIKAAHEQRTLTEVIQGLLKEWLEGGRPRGRRRRLALGAYKLGAPRLLTRRVIYEGLR